MCDSLDDDAGRGVRQSAADVKQQKEIRTDRKMNSRPFSAGMHV